MLDTLNLRGGSTSQSVHVNAVTGAILKNHPKSWFTRFNLTSKYAEALFAEGGHKAMKKVSVRYDPTDWRDYTRDERDPDKDITILQMVICGDMEVIAELVYTKDYEGREGPRGAEGGLTDGAGIL